MPISWNEIRHNAVAFARDWAGVAREDAEAKVTLGAIADAFLTHDREIVAACEDSVVRVVEEASYHIRRGRGLVPLPIRPAIALPSAMVP